MLVCMVQSLLAPTDQSKTCVWMLPQVSFTHHSSKAPSTFPSSVQAYWVRRPLPITMTAGQDMCTAFFLRSHIEMCGSPGREINSPKLACKRPFLRQLWHEGLPQGDIIIEDPHGMQADLKTGEGFDVMFKKMGPVDVVVNCAAVSSPALCEQFPAVARFVPCHQAIPFRDCMRRTCMPLDASKASVG